MKLISLALYSTDSMQDSVKCLDALKVIHAYVLCSMLTLFFFRASKISSKGGRPGQNKQAISLHHIFVSTN